ncbi:MAG: hypothetical protein QM759_08110 [Terricaulis sp.]
MPTRRVSERSTDVFINCPFDDEYAPLLRAIVFAIFACGYRSRCALEVTDGNFRFDKLKTLIEHCDFGIHDLSRTELSRPTATPRFNMPFELGLFLGATSFGGRRQKQKRALVLAENRERWAPSISDLAGVDPVYHDNDPARAIRAVRDFLDKTPDGLRLPGEQSISNDFGRFEDDLPRLARAANQTAVEARRYANYVTFVEEFLLSAD